MIGSGEPITVRGSVQWFSWHMESKLRLKDDRPGWHQMGKLDLYAWLQDEMTELLHALVEDDPEHIIEEAVDVANIAHMLAENAERSRTR